MIHCIGFLVGIAASPSLQFLKNGIEKHLSRVISAEQLLPWGTEMDSMTSWGLFQPCFLWSLNQHFSLLIPQSPKSDSTITLRFYSYTVFFLLDGFYLFWETGFNYIFHMLLLSGSLNLYFLFFHLSPLGLFSLFFKWVLLTSKLSQSKTQICFVDLKLPIKESKLEELLSAKVIASAATDMASGTFFNSSKEDKSGQQQMVRWGVIWDKGRFACLCRTWHGVALSLD